MSETFGQSRNALPPSHRRLLPSVKRHVAHSIALDYPKKKDERICYLYAAYNDRLAVGLNNPLKLMEKKVAMRNPLSPCGRGCPRCEASWAGDAYGAPRLHSLNRSNIDPGRCRQSILRHVSRLADAANPKTEHSFVREELWPCS